MNQIILAEYKNLLLVRVLPSCEAHVTDGKGAYSLPLRDNEVDWFLEEPHWMEKTTLHRKDAP
jgi:hypothetical protein